MQLRKSLDLYANVRPVSSTTGKIPIDLLIVRENTECLYIKQEKLEKDNRGLKVAYATRQISEFASTRIAKLAYSLASKRNKKQLTIVHKSNVLSVSDGLFRECCLEVSKDFPDIETNEQLVDSMVYRLYINFKMIGSASHNISIQSWHLIYMEISSAMALLLWLVV